MLPQLDLSSYASQVFWLLVCFCLLWATLSIFVTPKIADIVEQRKRKINEYIKKADYFNSQAKAALDKYNENMSQAEKISEQEIEKEKANLAAYLKETESKISAKLNKKIADNEFHLAKEKKDTLLQIENMTGDLALEIVHKLGFANITRHDIAKVSQKDKING